MREHRLCRSRHGILLGVCQGIADFFGISVAFVRILAFILLCSTGFFPFALIYLIAAIMLPVESY